MPSPYRRDLPRLKAEIVERAAAGESLRALGAAPGLPGPETVRKWARADAGFAAELAAARRRAEARALAFDAAVAATFLARARAGEAINDLLGEAGMPGRRAYRRWQATQAPFAQAVLALRQRRDREIGRHGRARLRTWDPRLAEAILTAVSGGATLEAALAADPALPCRPTVRRWRREQPEFDRMLRMIFAQWRARRYAARGCTPELAEAILGRIVEGASFASLGREPAMPSRQTLRQWVRVRRDFAAEVARACELREEWLHDEVVHIALRMPPGSVTAGKRAIGPLLRQMVRLRHRPGAVHRKRPASATARLACS